jgi:hypothetical protein
LDMHTLALVLFGAIGCFGGPVMMREAELLEAAGYPRVGGVFRRAAWVTLGLSPILAVLLVTGTIYGYALPVGSICLITAHWITPEVSMGSGGAPARVL